MENTNCISLNRLEIEVQIKLLDYLLTNKYITDGMYNYVINKLMNKIDDS